MEAQKKSFLDQLNNEDKENEILREKGWVTYFGFPMEIG